MRTFRFRFTKADFFYELDRSIIEIKAKTIPIIPKGVIFSLNITIPIKKVASKLITDHITPTIESWFFCIIAGNQTKIAKVLTIMIIQKVDHFGAIANFLDKNSQMAKKTADNINHQI